MWIRFGGGGSPRRSSGCWSSMLVEISVFVDDCLSRESALTVSQNSITPPISMTWCLGVIRSTKRISYDRLKRLRLIRLKSVVPGYRPDHRAPFGWIPCSTRRIGYAVVVLRLDAFRIAVDLVIVRIDTRLDRGPRCEPDVPSLRHAEKSVATTATAALGSSAEQAIYSRFRGGFIQRPRGGAEAILFL